MAEERKVYDFKGVGKTQSQNNIQYNIEGDPLPIGIATPIRLSTGASSLFEMHTNIKLSIRDNFRNMIATNHGERLMLNDFGANLKPLAYELGTDDGDGQALTRIAATTQKYMPYVALESFESIREKSNDGAISRVGVRISYSVPNLGIQSQVVDALILSAG